MEILKFPHPALSNPCRPVNTFGEHVDNLLDRMCRAAQENGGIGLAANQIGVCVQVFIMEAPDSLCSGTEDHPEWLCFINPEIVSKSIAPANIEEGCLSAPGTVLLRPDRAEWVQIKYQNVDGISRTATFHGIHAVCVQHEMEHLAGLSFMESKTIPKKKRLELINKWGRST